MKLFWKRSNAWIAALAIAGAAGCATVPETASTLPEVEGTEEEVVCSGACEEEWGRAEEWVKKHSGYPFPAEVTVKPNRIEASRIPIHNCESVPQTRRGSLCPELPLASEPLGLGDPVGFNGAVRIGQLYADGGPSWSFPASKAARRTPRLHRRPASMARFCPPPGR